MTTLTTHSVSPRYTTATSPAYTVVLNDDNGPITLTGCTSSSFTLTLWDIASNNVIKGAGTWSVTNATSGKASYQWTSGDLATPGTYRAYTTVKLPSESGTRAFDPDLIIINLLPNGVVQIMATQDVNLAQVNGAAISGSNPVPVSGSVSVSNLPATQPVSGSVSVSNFPATQPVSGTVGASSLPALPAGTNVIGHVIVDSAGSVAITSLPSLPAGTNTIGGAQLVDAAGTNKAAIDASGNLQAKINNFPATQTVSGSVSVSNFPATQPVSGSVSVSNFPATQNVNVTNANTNGQATMANSAPVVIASNQSPVPVSQPVSSTGTITSVAGTITANTQLLAANTNRKGMMIYNESSAVLYLAFSASCSTTSYTLQIPANSFFEMPTAPVYTGVISGV